MLIVGQFGRGMVSIEDSNHRQQRSSRWCLTTVIHKDDIMIIKTFFVLVLGLIPSISFASEIMAKARTWGWTLSVIAEGDAWEKSCKLKLVADIMMPYKTNESPCHEQRGFHNRAGHNQSPQVTENFALRENSWVQSLGYSLQDSELLF